MSDSDGEGSAPPDAEGDAVPADAAAGAAGGGAAAGGAAAAPTHPVWAAAAGGGSRRGSANQSGSMFAPISMMELEMRRRGDLDGASSTASDRGGSGSRSRRNKDRSSRGHKSRRERPQEYDEGDDSGGDEQASEVASDADLAGAAFGGKRKSCVPCGGSEVSDDAMSIASSQKRAAHDRAFPVEGVYCVGCTLPAKVVPVVDFIQKNMASMSELALFKMAALVYKTKVADPAEEEGVEVPPWHWKDIRDHFTLHAVDPKFQRFENIRTLGSMRKTLELQLLRRDSESGEMSLDKQNSETIMKIIAASSRELTLLHDATSTGKKR